MNEFRNVAENESEVVLIETATNEVESLISCMAPNSNIDAMLKSLIAKMHPSDLADFGRYAHSTVKKMLDLSGSVARLQMISGNLSREDLTNVSRAIVHLTDFAKFADLMATNAEDEVERHAEVGRQAAV